MRRSLLTCSCGLVVLLFGLGLLFVKRETSHSQPPPNATNVRVDRYRISEVHVNDQIPASGKLSDLYQYYSAHGWVRDAASERGLQRPWAEIPTTMFAVFTRQRLFGLVSETAIIGASTDTRIGVRVRQVRCITIDPWIRCL
jgi:hypothetical protein